MIQVPFTDWPFILFFFVTKGRGEGGTNEMFLFTAQYKMEHVRKTFFGSTRFPRVELIPRRIACVSKRYTTAGTLLML